MSKRTILILAAAAATLAILFVAAESQAAPDRPKKDCKPQIDLLSTAVLV